MTKKKDPRDLEKPIVLDPSKVEALAAIQCTYEEIADGLDISLSTLERRRKDTPEIDEALKKGRTLGRRSLRRLQYKAAKSGNITMLIWLGKQYLGQSDKAEITGAERGPIVIIRSTEENKKIQEERRKREEEENGQG